MDSQEHFKLVEARCSGFAAEFLHQLKDSPLLPALLTELQTIDGIIFRTDIECALSAIRIPHMPHEHSQ